jgi:hypothetical protein
MIFLSSETPIEFLLGPSRRNLMLFKLFQYDKNTCSYPIVGREVHAKLAVIDAAKAIFWSGLYFRSACEGFDGR